MNVAEGEFTGESVVAMFVGMVGNGLYENKEREKYKIKI